jgi:hypothetical protein
MAKKKIGGGPLHSTLNDSFRREEKFRCEKLKSSALQKY